MKTILVVDDEEHIRRLYEAELAEEGYSVITAATGKEALEKLGESLPDLVIMDIKMPGINGIETIQKMLAKDSTIPVIINTAYSSYKDSFLAWSADEYVVKSSDLTELKEKVRKLIGPAEA